MLKQTESIDESDIMEESIKLKLYKRHLLPVRFD